MTSGSARLVLLLLALCACHAPAPAPAPAPAASPVEAQDPVASDIAGFRAAVRQMYTEYKPKLDEAMRRGEPGPTFDPSAILEQFFPRLASAADRGDPRALGWCIEQLSWQAPVVQQALKAGGAQRWWAAFRVSNADAETLARVLRAMPGMAYFFPDGAEACAEFEARSPTPELKALALDTQISMLRAYGTPIEMRQPLLERLARDYPETREGNEAAATLLQARVLQIGKPFPGWAERSFRDLARAIEAPEEPPAPSVRLSEYRGKVVALIFWDYYCGFCKAELPFEREMLARLAPRGVEIVGVYTDPDLEHCRKMLKTMPAPWRSIWDGPGKMRAGPLMTELGVDGVPFTVVLDGEGIVRAVGPRNQRLEKAIEDVLAARPVADLR